MEEATVLPRTAIPIRATPKWSDGPFPGITIVAGPYCWLSPGVSSATVEIAAVLAAFGRRRSFEPPKTNIALRLSFHLARLI